MGTVIKITPPGGIQEEIKAFETCRTTLSATDRAGSFSLALPSFSNDLLDKFPVGSDVQITQGDGQFRGWVVKPPKRLNNLLRIVSLEGSSYASKTQKIVINESYIETPISDIVADLFTKYVPWATRNNIQDCTKIITVRFPDKFLWDAMEQLCEISNYNWYIDEFLDVNFFGEAERFNPTVLSQYLGNYRQGTANFTPDASKLVNRLWVKGGKALSDPYTQNIAVNGTTPIPLFYTPRAPDGESVTVTISGSVKTVGIQNITKAGTTDFLLNASEKLLLPDLCTSGSGTISYRYEYPIKLLLEDFESQKKYGLFEDILTVDTDDKTLAKEQGMRHLAKYANPVVTGSIEPLQGSYKPGELIKIEIPDLAVDEYMQIKEVTCESIKGMGITRTSLNLESPERDAVAILKDMNKRLMRLEKSVYNDNEGPVEKYIVFTDSITTPQLIDTGLTWNLHQYKLCGDIKCSSSLII